MGGLMGGGPSESSAAAAARKKQEESLKAQEAQALRDQIEADEREEELSGNLATQRRAIAARRRTRGGLAYAANSTVKTTLGG